ncbi:MAG: trypsin-like serine protease [Dysgonamonadaceae bacterium]
MKIKKTISFFIPSLIVIMSCFPVKAQISFGGKPPSFLSIQKAQSTANVPVKSFFPKENIQLLKKQDVYAKENGAPPIVATLIPSTVDLAASGQWELLSGDSICRLTIESTGAEGILLYYSKFNIPSGGKLFLYNADGSQILGAYTSETNKKGGRFSTEIIYGDKLTLEYVQPKGTAKPDIRISDIGYGYNVGETIVSGSSLLRAGTNDCMVDINCSPEGDQWQQQKKGVAKIIVRIGSYSYLCSGSLVNNVYQDHTPYFLSAHHCFDENGSTADFSSIQFYFHYESTDCGTNVISSKTKTMIGADLLVDAPLVGGSDGSLLRLTDTIPSSYDVYYNGWDISETPPTRGVIIHHPNGDLKKISTYTQQPTTVTFVDGSNVSTEGGHWKVVYATTTNGYSVTAGGSSGSPMFNQNGHIVGTLTGGTSQCSSPSDPDYYGKFYYHWNKSNDSTQWMSKYLNAPNYSAITAINGIDGYTKGDTLTGQNYLKIAPVITNGYLYVTTTYAISEIRVYNLAGRLITRSNSLPVNATKWPKGVYIVVVETSGGRGKGKTLKD